ncbi:MAG TPA: cytochrome b562 [Gemmatimonadaceae bacterium]|nr:cytochrome b562 [Gemmatimonadaceae bacterium]
MRSIVRHLGTALLLALALTNTAAAQDADKTPLGQRMSAMNEALKKITAQVADPAMNASTLEQVAIFKSNANEALTFTPEKTATMPEGEQEQFVADFQTGLKALLVTVDSLEAAVTAGRNTDAVALIDVMKKTQREKHGVFRIRKPGLN